MNPEGRVRVVVLCEFCFRSLKPLTKVPLTQNKCVHDIIFN